MCQALIIHMPKPPLTLNRNTLAVVNRLYYKDDGWVDRMRAEITGDEKAWNALLDDKEREL